MANASSAPEPLPGREGLPSPARVSDVERLRADFPILARRMRKDRPLAYLDNAATTQKPVSVIEAEAAFYRTCNANVHRSLHGLSAEATRRFEAARQRLATLIGARDPRSIVFTRGATEGINLVAHGWARQQVRAGDAIVVTEMEHHSNFVPWQQVALERGATLRQAPLKDDATLDGDGFARALEGPVKLVAATHVSNVTGVVNPVERMIEAAHRVGAVFVLDAAQSAPGMRLDVESLGCDFAVFSGHKMLGPTGIGVLYARLERLEAMTPPMTGGDMIERVTLEQSTWADLPHRFEAGTPHIAGAIALAEAAAYLEALGLEAIEARDAALARRAADGLRARSGVTVLGPVDPVRRGGAVAFTVDGVHPHDVAQILDAEGVAIRAGHLCAQPLMRRLGVSAVNRASFYFYNTEREVDRLIEGVVRAQRMFADVPG